MNFFIFLTNRLIKLFGHSCKMLCYVFHFFFPNKRFTIPKKSKALIKTKNRGKIPKILWQTNFTNHVTLPVYLNYLFNRGMSPSFEYRLKTDEDISGFVYENCSKSINRAFSKLQVGAAQADFWRVLVLEKVGGVYLDIDATLIWPLDLLVKKEISEFFITSRKKNLSNYFLASQKNNPHLNLITNAIVGEINSGKDFETIYDVTGPGIIDKTLLKSEVDFLPSKLICVQGCFTNEYFQYIDKKEGKWTHANKEDLIAD